MDLATMIAAQRFYGAKTEKIDDVRVLCEKELGANTWCVSAVTHGGRVDLFQLLIDAQNNDVLDTAGAAARYAEALPLIGDAHGDIALDASDAPRPIITQQSNSSIVFGDRMLKVYRRLEEGMNPDVELLSRLEDCSHIAPVRGWVTRSIGGRTFTLAMVQDLVPGGRDGWDLATTMAGKRSFAEEARLLGQATASVHDALAEAFPEETAPARMVATWLEDRYRELAEEHEVLRQFEEPVLDIYRKVEERGGKLKIQRIHGDLHLGQVLRTEEGYVLIDFEGEPARSLEERRMPDLKLRDVAGLIRSLDYAAHFHGQHTEWGEEAVAALVEGYGEVDRLLLNAYVVDKACYEVAYELGHRPDWVGIPLEGLKRMLNR